MIKLKAFLVTLGVVSAMIGWTALCVSFPFIMLISVLSVLFLYVIITTYKKAYNYYNNLKE